MQSFNDSGGGAIVLGKLPAPGYPTLLMIVGHGPTALVVGAGGGCLDIFTLIYLFSSLSPSLSETARYRLKCCLNGPLYPKQPTNLTTVFDSLERYQILLIFSPIGQEYPFLQGSEIFLSRPAISA